MQREALFKTSASKETSSVLRTCICLEHLGSDSAHIWQPLKDRKGMGWGWAFMTWNGTNKTKKI